MKCTQGFLILHCENAVAFLSALKGLGYEGKIKENKNGKKREK